MASKDTSLPLIDALLAEHPTAKAADIEEDSKVTMTSLVLKFFSWHDSETIELSTKLLHLFGTLQANKGKKFIVFSQW